LAVIRDVASVKRTDLDPWLIFETALVSETQLEVWC